VTHILGVALFRTCHANSLKGTSAIHLHYTCTLPGASTVQSSTSHDVAVQDRTGLIDVHGLLAEQLVDSITMHPGSGVGYGMSPVRNLDCRYIHYAEAGCREDITRGRISVAFDIPHGTTMKLYIMGRRWPQPAGWLRTSKPGTWKPVSSPIPTAGACVVLRMQSALLTTTTQMYMVRNFPVRKKTGRHLHQPKWTRPGSSNAKTSRLPVPPIFHPSSTVRKVSTGPREVVQSCQ
jgi:hypothetical protein